jgi:hypothetical protein
MMFRRFLGALALCLLGLSAAPALAQQGDPSFNLVNRSGRLIFEAYASLATDQDWGPDRLGDNALPNGRSFARPVITPPTSFPRSIRRVSAPILPASPIR